MHWIYEHLGEIIFALAFVVAALGFAFQKPKVCCKCGDKDVRFHKIGKGKYICYECLHHGVQG